MDPISTALITALAALEAGAASGLTEVSKAAISDAYHTLKDLLVRKSGAKSDVALAIRHLEAKPDSRGRQETLQEEITAATFLQDTEALASAQHVLTLVQPQQAGQGKFTIQNNAHVQGQNIGDHNVINQQFGKVP